MTKKEFQKELKSSVNMAVQRANKFLEQRSLNESQGVVENGFEKYIIKRKNPQQNLAESLSVSIINNIKSLFN